MIDPTQTIKRAFPSVWEVSCHMSQDGEVVVEIHATPQGDLCEVALSRLVDTLYPALSYILSIMYHWAGRRMERMLLRAQEGLL